MQSAFGEALEMAKKTDHTAGTCLETFYYIARDLESFKCCFAPKHCNRASDSLANFAKDTVLDTWVDLPPEFLSHILLLDSV